MAIFWQFSKCCNYSKILFPALKFGSLQGLHMYFVPHLHWFRYHFGMVGKIGIFGKYVILRKFTKLRSPILALFVLRPGWNSPNMHITSFYAHKNSLGKFWRNFGFFDFLPIFGHFSTFSTPHKISPKAGRAIKLHILRWIMGILKW